MAVIQAMTPETYVIGSILLSVIVVAMLYFSRTPPNDFNEYFSPTSPNDFNDFMKCPRCGAEMEIVGGGGVYVIHVVPEIPWLRCPQCGYSERLEA